LKKKLEREIYIEKREGKRNSRCFMDPFALSNTTVVLFFLLISWVTPTRA
jgi:hypothetical protein